MIYEELLKCVNDFIVVDFCKLYILLCLSKFLLPNTKGTVHSGLFGVLCKYNWGGIIYQYLVRSLCEGTSSIRNDTTPSNVYIIGCTYMLQVISIIS